MGFVLNGGSDDIARGSLNGNLAGQKDKVASLNGLAVRPDRFRCAGGVHDVFRHREENVTFDQISEKFIVDKMGMSWRKQS